MMQFTGVAIPSYIRSIQSIVNDAGITQIGHRRNPFVYQVDSVVNATGAKEAKKVAVAIPSYIRSIQSYIKANVH